MIAPGFRQSAAQFLLRSAAQLMARLWAFIGAFLFVGVMQKSSLHQPIEIKISTVVAVSVILRETALDVLDEALTEMTGGAADFFDDEFAVLDLSHIGQEQANIDWAGLVKLLKSYGLNAVAVRNSKEVAHDAIVAQGLSIDSSAKPLEHLPLPKATVAPVASVAPVAVAVTTAPVAVTPAPAQIFDTVIIDTPVRAGQRIYARGADLIITAVVNNGAEIIADGSIHVYAPMRGRALAGANGNAGARIFAFALEPELVSIAGVYRTFEDGLPANISQQPSQVKLIGERIEIMPVGPVSKM